MFIDNSFFRYILNLNHFFDSKFTGEFKANNLKTIEEYAFCKSNFKKVTTSILAEIEIQNANILDKMNQ